MADRLQELLQQRALIREHLAWLEGEIAAASGRPQPVDQATSPAPVAAAPVVAPAATATAPSSASVTTRRAATREDPEAMIARLAAAEKTSPLPTKKGCWLVFVCGLILFGVAAWVLLRFLYRE